MGGAPAVGFVETTGAVRLGEIGFESEEVAWVAVGVGVVEDLAVGGGGDGMGGVSLVCDHDRVHNANRHPANHGEDEGQRRG